MDVKRLELPTNTVHFPLVCCFNHRNQMLIIIFFSTFPLDRCFGYIRETERVRKPLAPGTGIGVFINCLARENAIGHRETRAKNN